jgi:hypothetical protein
MVDSFETVKQRCIWFWFEAAMTNTISRARASAFQLQRMWSAGRMFKRRELN